jgi:hypothetical protein
MAECRGCGAPITWAVTKEGTKIPLDMRPPVYEIMSLNPFDPASKLVAVRLDKHRFGVTHFSTCPKANEFSASKKPKGETDVE